MFADTEAAVGVFLAEARRRDRLGDETMVVLLSISLLVLTVVVALSEIAFGLALRKGENRWLGLVLLFGIGFTAALAVPLILVGTCIGTMVPGGS